MKWCECPNPAGVFHCYACGWPIRPPYNLPRGAEQPGVAQPERHSEAYDPGPRRRIGGQYFDVDDVPPRGDRDY